MVRLLRFLIAVIPLSAVFFSCSRESEQSFLPNPIITITAPASSAVYHYGDTVYIKASINGSAAVHGYEVAVRPVGSHNNFFFQHHHEHAQALEVLEKWKNNLTQPTQMLVEVSALLDEQAHKKTQTVTFQISN